MKFQHVKANVKNSYLVEDISVKRHVILMNVKHVKE